jgi:hypothetical protein
MGGKKINVPDPEKLPEEVKACLQKTFRENGSALINPAPHVPLKDVKDCLATVEEYARDLAALLGSGLGPPGNSRHFYAQPKCREALMGALANPRCTLETLIPALKAVADAAHTASESPRMEKRTKGGRPKNRALINIVGAIAEVYGKETNHPAWSRPNPSISGVGKYDSPFSVFAMRCFQKYGPAGYQPAGKDIAAALRNWRKPNKTHPRRP